MPVYEIKNPQPPPAEPQPAPRRTEPVEQVAPIIKIRHLPRQPPDRRPNADNPAAEKTADPTRRALQQQIDRLNGEFTRHGLDIHLRLVATGDALTLEIYDCSSGQVCAVVHDREIALPELAGFLVRLQQHAGLIVDTVS